MEKLTRVVRLLLLLVIGFRWFVCWLCDEVVKSSGLFVALAGVLADCAR